MALNFSLLLDCGVELAYGGVRRAADIGKGDPGCICPFCGRRMLNQLKLPCVNITLRTLNGLLFLQN